MEHEKFTKSSVSSFNELIEQIDLEATSQRDRGTLFEYIVKAYLKNDPMYQLLFKDVWLLKEVPDKFGIPKKDTGVDLVALERKTNFLVAIQCKFYSSDTTISKTHIDSFLNEMGKRHYSSGIVIATTDKWTSNAEEALLNRDKPITRIGLEQIRESRIDWAKFSQLNPEVIILQTTKEPKSYQKDAINAVIDGFDSADRGKLIMAPGTGKTYTSLKIAEQLAKKKENIFYVLYLVPSIQLLSQTLRSWTNDSNLSLDTIAVCSDKKVTKKSSSINDNEDIFTLDIGYPATTNYESLLKYKSNIENSGNKANMIVVFSTYQSIEVITKAQKKGFYAFDLIIADEAHRTTGFTERNEDVSPFLMVHKNDYINGRKRLYQTATPRIFGDSALQKADELSIVVADMNDASIYGDELYHLGFGDAVYRGILTDYKVMILTVDEMMVQQHFQQMFAEKNSELEFNDATKIIGCWNGLLKRKSNSNELFGYPMKRAIAFTGTIKQSKLITSQFNEVVNHYLGGNKNTIESFKIEIEHADGTMNALQKNHKIDWLKSPLPDNTCRILSNARFLTEGVDVPDLDAVLFLQPRRSTIDIAQAVGRVMRKSPGKEYGYVILPIGIPSGLDENTILDNNEKFSVVWDVLNALRSIDERFDAMINKIELNKKKPNQIDIIGVGAAPEFDDDENGFALDSRIEQLSMDLTDDQLSTLARAVFGKIVKKVGNTRYWETWSKDIYDLAQLYFTRIKAILIKDEESDRIFNDYLKSLRYNINNSISVDQAIEMIAQHAITKPVFDSLFEQESFALNNPISKAMNKMILHFEELGFNKEQEKLSGFYESVSSRAQGIDNLEAKQKIIIQLYEKFFKIGFPKTTESLGIVFTPTEVVDFILNSVNDSLQRYFGRTLSDENVNILDPFTGTGTFIAKLLQSNLIKKEDILRKYNNEIYANEIVLLSYYIASINIEETFKEVTKSDVYVPFEGIVFTDTFESTERDGTLDNDLFDMNNERLIKQKESPITIIIGNPPYSGGATSDNDNNSNPDYFKLDKLIENTYAKYTSAKMKKSLYDSYIRAFKWASERISEKGIIGFVTNGSFIDGQTTDGLRKCWFEEFNYIYIFNLRGDAYTQGEKRQKEKGNIFGSGSRASIAITILVKDQSNNHEIYYQDIGDYLTTEEKLDKIRNLKSISNINWNKITPNNSYDWINKRDENYSNFVSLIDDRDSIFLKKLTGVNTSRDAWVYGFSKNEVVKNVQLMIKNYNSEVDRLVNVDLKSKSKSLNMSPSYVNWSRSLRVKIEKNQKIDVKNLNDYLVLSQYRPFVKKWLVYQKDVVEMPGKYMSSGIKSGSFKLIQTTGKGNKKEFSSIVLSHIPNFDCMSKGQGYSLETTELDSGLDLSINDFNINENFLKKLGLDYEEAFYYVYAILHSKEYLTKFKENLTKETPRIPILPNPLDFARIGKELANLHLDYENIDGYPHVEVEFSCDSPTFEVEKMRFHGKDKSIIIYNRDIKICKVPLRAYNYVVNGRSAIEWIMEKYQLVIDKESGIVDNPNHFSDNKKYIFNLLLSIINLSMKTLDIVDSMPKLEI